MGLSEADLFAFGKKENIIKRLFCASSSVCSARFLTTAGFICVTEGEKEPKEGTPKRVGINTAPFRAV